MSDNPINVFIDDGEIAIRGISKGRDRDGGAGIGITGESDVGTGVYGSSETFTGVGGVSQHRDGVGVWGENTRGGYGVTGSTTSDSAGGDPQKATAGVLGTNNGNGLGVKGTSQGGVGVFGQGAVGVAGFGPGEGESGVGVSGNGSVGIQGSGSASGVLGSSRHWGVNGGSFPQLQPRDPLLAGLDTVGVIGMMGDSPRSFGVAGVAISGWGVYGRCVHGAAVQGQVLGRDVTDVAVSGYVVGPPGGMAYAGYFTGGRVHITDFLEKAGGGFRVDRPSDPAHKYLNHGFVESSDMKNIYDGTVTLDQKGEATVTLASWLETLNESFRYQLTPVGGPAPNLHIADELHHGRFRIAGGKARSKVCWQITGVRRDPWAKANQIVVEEEKSGEERGRYLHPELFDQPEEKSIRALRFADHLRK